MESPPWDGWSPILARGGALGILVEVRFFVYPEKIGLDPQLQDNRSTILLERDASSGKQTRHINIWYFFITNRIHMKEIEVKWCPIKEMVADFMTKPLQGSHFRRLYDLIMGMTSIKKSKIPNKSTVTVTKRDGRIKVMELKRSQTAVRPDSPTSVGLLAQ